MATETRWSQASEEAQSPWSGDIQALGERLEGGRPGYVDKMNCAQEGCHNRRNIFHDNDLAHCGALPGRSPVRHLHPPATALSGRLPGAI